MRQQQTPTETDWICYHTQVCSRNGQKHNEFVFDCNPRGALSRILLIVFLFVTRLVYNSSKYFFIGGIDLDFFQPRTMEELENYVVFLSEAITQWHHQGLKVSMTLHPGLGKYIPNNIYELLDRIHFMAYDIVQGGGYHASISKVVPAVEELLQQKVHSHKVLLGIPAYSRHKNNPGQVKTFAEICDEIQKDASHDERKNVYTDLNSWHGYTWESPVRIRNKINLAKKLKLGGVFFWELGQDKTTKDHPGGILLEAASAATAGMEDDVGEL